MFADVHIRTRRLLIRAFRDQDGELLHPILSDPAVVRYLPEEVMDADATRAVLARLVASYDRNAPGRIQKFTAAVLRAEDEQLIGWVGLGALDFEPGSIELYYGYGSAHWGHGYATEAGEAMLEFAFEVVGLERVIGIVHAENRASRTVLRKLGMRFRSYLGEMPLEHAFFEGLPTFELSRETFRRSARSGFTVRRMPSDQLTRLAEIDRSEHVTLLYSFEKGRLSERAVDLQDAGWVANPEHAHSAAALIRQFSPMLSEGAHLLGAFAGERIIGLGIVRPKLTPEMAQLALLHVTRDHRRQGVATRLTEEMLRLARWEGARRIYVSATPSQSAVGFYQYHGFVPTSDVHPELFELEPEDIHMIRPL